MLTRVKITFLPFRTICISIVRKSRHINLSWWEPPFKFHSRFSHTLHPSKFYPELSQNDPRLCWAIDRAREQNIDPDLNRPRTVILEGERLISDAIRSGGRIHSLYFSSRSSIDSLDLQACDDNVFYVPLKILKQFSLLKTCPGILAVFEIPSLFRNTLYPLCDSLWRPLPAVLILDNIRDPGNMGTLIRTAAGFGLSAVITSKGCVDVWNEKVVRAGMSAHFRVPVYPGLQWSEIERLAVRSDEQATTPLKVYVADAATEGQVGLPGHFQEVSSSSLPVNDGSQFLDNKDTDNEDLMRACLPNVAHFSTNYFAENGRYPDKPEHLTDNHCSPLVALVIGSEAHGPSREAYVLSSLTGGCRLFVPCPPQTDSLSVTVAGAVILGEMQRQYFAQLM